MTEEEPQYICLNYCMVDQETGYCLTCGRPPPLTDFSQKTFAGISLSGKPVTATATTDVRSPLPEDLPKDPPQS